MAQGLELSVSTQPNAICDSSASEGDQLRIGGCPTILRRYAGDTTQRLGLVVGDRFRLFGREGMRE